MLNFEEVEADYRKVKYEFQNEDNAVVASRIAGGMGQLEKTLGEVFKFIIPAFKGKLRNDKKTPLVFHSIYLTRLLYTCGERDADSLLTAALHDVLEDTEISEEVLLKESFMVGREYLIDYLRRLKEDTGLSREPDGETLPPRYMEHIKRLIGSSREVVNTEILDRFSDLMDLEYITNLPEEEKRLRLRSKIIKVRSFVENITRNRDDYNKDCLNLFWKKIKILEEEWKISANATLIL